MDYDKFFKRNYSKFDFERTNLSSANFEIKQSTQQKKFQIC